VLKPSFKVLAGNWWPVALWEMIIRMESTDYASAGNTFSLLYKVCTTIFTRVDPVLVFEVDEVLRKLGHFTGYAILSALTFLALKHTHRDRLKPVLQRTWGIFFRDTWQFNWAVIAVLLTLVTAALDEIHQTFLPSRTGRWQDVVIDTSGALVTQMLIYALSVHAMNRRRLNSLEGLEASLTR
jgi:VanZ family protein